MVRTRDLGLLALVVGALVGALAVPAGAAGAVGASTCGTDVAVVDYDGDGCADLAIASPDAVVAGLAGAGRVQVEYGNGTSTFGGRRAVLDVGSVGVVLPQAGAHFGASMASAKVDEDFYTDLVIGVPGQDVAGHAGAGAVVVVHGGPGGLGADQPSLLVVQGTAPGTGAVETGDGFGSSLDARGTEIVVGVPGEDVGTVPDAGCVVWLGFSPEGVLGRLWSQAGAVPGAPEAGDRMGEAVIFAPNGGMVVGLPGEDVGTVRDAGAVLSLNGGADRWAVFSQETARMPGVAERGDRFGSALASLVDRRDGGNRVAIGVPGEDVAGVRDAGLVEFIVAADTLAELRPQPWALGQDTSGVAGVAEVGDRFGTVLEARPVLDRTDLLVGIPHEDVGGAADAGAVEVVRLPLVSGGSRSVAGSVVTQATSGVSGTVEAGDRFGAALTTVGADPSTQAVVPDVYAGVPGEDHHGSTDAGSAQGIRGSFVTLLPSTPEPGQHFGATLSRRG